MIVIAEFCGGPLDGEIRDVDDGDEFLKVPHPHSFEIYDPDAPIDPMVSMRFSIYRRERRGDQYGNRWIRMVYEGNR